ncbi:MAG TPA: GIY-YIG nuclease family protein [Xanthobacteraceae bacterium]|nr:GIY-YIG nuclease family protein [Xanthobacteraceae bacterium]
MNEQFYVYILASRKHGTLYIGVTNDIVRRVHEHKLKFVKGFSAKYGVDKLVYFEIFDDPTSAISREKQLKKWHRGWKLDLIESRNPGWVDLSHTLT